MLDTNAIGKIVREERKALGLRQAALAAASGVGVRFLVDLERGKPTVQLGRVLAVLAALGCSLDIRSEEHTSELQSLMRISYAVFCLNKKSHQVQSYNTDVDGKSQEHASSCNYL